MVGWIVRVEECPRGKLPGAYEEQSTGCPHMEIVQTASSGDMTHYSSIHMMECYTVLQNDVCKPFVEKLGSRLNGRRMVDTCDLFLDTFAYNLYSICMGIAL